MANPSPGSATRVWFLTRGKLILAVVADVGALIATPSASAMVPFCFLARGRILILALADFKKGKWREGGRKGKGMLLVPAETLFAPAPAAFAPAPAAFASAQAIVFKKMERCHCISLL
jgi:hypothetical protein